MTFDPTILIDGTLAVAQFVTTVVGAATVLLQVIPQLDASNKLKPTLQFVGRWIALNKPVVESFKQLPFYKKK